MRVPIRPSLLVLSLLLALAQPAARAEARAPALVADLGCPACHAGLGVATEVATRAPDLSYAGSRYQQSYLFDYLLEPRRVRRHIGAARMPDFRLGEEEALALALFLGAQRDEPAAAMGLGAVHATAPAAHAGAPGGGSAPAAREATGEAEPPAEGARGAAPPLLADLRQHSCLTCHTWNGRGGIRGPELADFGARLDPAWVRRFLEAPAAYGVPDGLMPALFLVPGEDGAAPVETVPGARRALERIVTGGAAAARERREEMAQAFAAARARHPEIGVGDGERVFRALNCAACHRIAGISARAGDAPDLGGEGLRVREPWLRAFLAAPTQVRPAGGAPGSASRMPDFRLTDVEVDAIAPFLLERRRGAASVREDFAAPRLTAYAMRKAEALLREKLACLGCHRLGDGGGTIGPDLGGVAARLQPGFVEAIVRDPQAVVPHAVMPRLPLPERTRELVVAYLLQRDAVATGGPAALSPLDAHVPPAVGADGGAATYARLCASCHGATGGGDGFNAPFLPVPPTAHADAAYLSGRPDDTLFDGIAAGGAVLGRSHLMPAWGETLDAPGIAELVAHLRDLCRCSGPAWSLARDALAAREAAAPKPAPSPQRGGTSARGAGAAPGDPAPAALPPPLPTPGAPAVTFADFVGAEACRPCHAEQYEAWAGSTHGRAGGLPGDVELIARFDGKPIRLADAVVVPKLGTDGKPRFVVERRGGAREEIEVAAVVGGGHMLGGGTQSFFVEEPDGTLRFLPFDFIRGEDVWFGQLRDLSWAPLGPKVRLADLLNWPPARILGNAPQFSNCDVCHGSQIQVLPAKRGHVMTRFRSLTVNCESCHGPGRRHVAWARSPERDESGEIFLAPLDPLEKDASLQVCFQCHASRPVLDPDYLPGRGFEDYFALKYLLLEDNPYFPDGRIQSFSYQDNHQFSDCYVSGSMVCTDCHDPHSQRYRDVFARPLEGRFDDAQCTSCHASKAVEGEAHTHHVAGSPGAACTSCHMPFLQQPTVGKKLRFARSDHTVPIPRPAFDHALGIENACSKCHPDRSVAALQKQTGEWWGPLKPHPAAVTDQIAAAKVRSATKAAPLLLRPDDAHAMVQFASLASFARRFLVADARNPDPEVLRRLEELSQNPDVDVSSLALASLHFTAGDDPRVRALLADALARLGARDRAVRLRWASALRTIGGAREKAGNRGAREAAERKVREILPDGPRGRLWGPLPLR